MERRAFLRKAAFGLMATVTVPFRGTARAADPPVRVLCWSELTEPTDVYPEGTSGAIAKYLNTQSGLRARTGSIEDHGQGISNAVLEETDVLIWWGHRKHDQISPDRVAEVVRRVKDGKLGFIGIHSGKDSRIFQSLLNDTGKLGAWRHDAGPETLKVVAPFHPIASGFRDFKIPETEMYNEPFRIPPPETVIFFSYWKTEEQIRSGCVWKVGKGRVFYFRPGHETHPIFFQPIPRKIVANGARWCAHRT